VVGARLDQEAAALVQLKMASGLGDRRISALVSEYGSGTAALRAVMSQGRLFESGERAPSTGAWRKRGIRAVPMTSPDYPPALRNLADPPPLLFLKGRPALLQGPAVAIVGARRATEGGRDIAQALGRILGSAGITVVSGMARGIDGAAHRGALQAGGDTLAVLGAGLEVVYPRLHGSLFKEVGKRGLLLSEFLPWEAARPHHFPKRNRVIAALARAIVVVEAGERSGAFITVDHGLDLGREILAVPGSLRNPQARGTNALIRDGARLLTSPEAILDELPELAIEAAARREETRASDGARPTEESAPCPVPDDDGSGEMLESLWKALGPGPEVVDVLAERAGMTAAEAMAGLSSLELLGRATRCPGMRFRRG
jgi:DNA processing protein